MPLSRASRILASGGRDLRAGLVDRLVRENQDVQLDPARHAHLRIAADLVGRLEEAGPRDPCVGGNAPVRGAGRRDEEGIVGNVAEDPPALGLDHGAFCVGDRAPELDDEVASFRGRRGRSTEFGGNLPLDGGSLGIELESSVEADQGGALGGDRRERAAAGLPDRFLRSGGKAREARGGPAHGRLLMSGSLRSDRGRCRDGDENGGREKRKDREHGESSLSGLPGTT